MEQAILNDETISADKDPEIFAGDEGGFPRGVTALFPAIANKNYRMFFAGQFISVTGTWVQTVAQGWLVFKLTDSAFMVGFVAAFAAVPTLFFSLFGGAIVDRFSTRRILIFTQLCSMTLAFILGILAMSGIIAVWEIQALAFLLGSVHAIDAPARQAFVVEMVGKEVLPSAIALNSAIFSGARLIGPGIAGLFIALIGAGGAFILNGISYVPVIFTLIIMRVASSGPKKQLHPIEAIRQGLSYSFNHPVIRALLIYSGIFSVFGWSYTTIMPVIAKNTFHIGPLGLGSLYMAVGSGSLVAIVLLSALSKKVSAFSLIIGGNAIFAVSLLLFTFTSNLALALPLLFLSGLGLILQFSTMNSAIQNLVYDEVRGRVMSIYILMFLGLSPLGNLEIGWLSERAGTAVALRVGATLIFIFGILVLMNRKKLGAAYTRYQEEAVNYA